MLINRLIPAHAGKTNHNKPTRTSIKAHPRSRGENAGTSLSSMMLHGSSPLTRGKPRLRSRSRQLQRLIPAHAGKTPFSPLTCITPPAHPRSRGENACAPASPTSWRGSSPLTRGKLHILPQRRNARRLIPAHAGKTSTAIARPPRSGAHPRSRGENVPPGPRRVWIEGSSPLTRGKHPHGIHRVPVWRLIPAHAGKTPPASARQRGPSAHPRSRGENLTRRGGGWDGPGSSPLTRGKRLRPA